MSQPIECYALIGNGRTAALVSRDGSIDWLCLPNFDSGACFARLLGDDENGFWQISPKGDFKVERRYQENTVILETIFTTSTGKVRLTDWMPPHDRMPFVFRRVEGLEGRVEMEMTYVVRFDYGHIVPWVTRDDGVLQAIAGPDKVYLRSPIPVQGRGLQTVADFTIDAGQSNDFALGWSASEKRVGHLPSAEDELARTHHHWTHWVNQCAYKGIYSQQVTRSLLTLKALTFEPTGGIVAAPTTSLPEAIGGIRNWDYRFCWVRDSTFALYSLLHAGYEAEAAAWREWLLRAVAGTPQQVNIMYGIHGERRLLESELDWLQGYESSKPVRVGNKAYEQRQLDIFGELMDTLHLARRRGIHQETDAWNLQKNLLKYVAESWAEPDEGIWEMRGGQYHFVHSKVMAWVAVTRSIQSAEKFGLQGDVKQWRELQARIHQEVCEKGFNKEINSFTQRYGSKNVDASLLRLPLVGFLPPHDPRIIGTVKRVEEELLEDGFVLRYRVESTPDGLKGKEGAFLACSFWLVDAYALLGRKKEAREMFERLIGLVNDVGLLSEEYDTERKRLVGNFPQAFSHIGLINSAFNLANHGPARDRSELCPYCE